MPEAKGTNREHKDRLFKFIFGNPEHKAWTLSLYNAVNGSSYTNPDDIRITTIEDVVYLHMKNDVSFLLDGTMSFYEEQSSYNPNMPMRFLIYAGMVYSKYTEEDKRYRKYSTAQQKAPTPKCVCFYNGTADKEDKIVLSLKDSFTPGSEPDIEVKVTMLNVNYGHNRKLLDACEPMKEYSFFIDRIRAHRKQTDRMEEAIDAALEELDNGSVIKPFLIANRAEVKRMCITEYDEERTLAETREEGIEEGIAIGEKKGKEEGIAIGEKRGKEEGIAIGEKRGRVEGTIRTLTTLVNKGLLSIADAASAAEMSVAEFELAAKAYI